MIYFVIFKNKKDKEYKMFSNTIFDNEKEANQFGKSSMSRQQEHKVVEYNKENYNKYWGNGKKNNK
jgi:hypothetical protein